MKKDVIIGDRTKLVEDYVRGKTVLDLGCVDSDAIRSQNPKWLHNIIKNNAKHVLGVDKAKPEVKKLIDAGYNIKCADVENMRLNKKFDVVVAGELIEHLDNPGMFLDSVRKHIKDNGRFIITTPSPYYVKNLTKALGNNHFYTQSNIHVSFYTPGTLEQLLIRHGFSVEKLIWIGRPIKKKYAPVKVLMRAFPALHLGFAIVAKPSGGRDK